MKCLFAAALAASSFTAPASDHLDSPKVIADPRTDIGDVYAWTSADGLQLNLAMTIVGHTLSNVVDYTFHIDSGKHFRATTASTDIACTFKSMKAADCRLGKVDRAVGDPSGSTGLAGGKGRFKVYAGLRDDPFFNNVKGSRSAFDYAAAQLRDGTRSDEAACPLFTAVQSAEILRRWKHTDGAAASNFLAGWTPASIVIAVDLAAVNQGGGLLAVWADTSIRGLRIDRAGRPLTGNALLAPLAADDVSDALKMKYNEATPATAAGFIPEIEKSLALYDGYDGHCGNQLLVDPGAEPANRYTAMATVLADDRLWVNSASSTCTQLFAVEIAASSGGARLADDCGGRTPNYDAVNVYRSYLAAGASTGVDDGVHRDELVHSDTVFPFLAAPAGKAKY